ncbi:15-hydroxyprostaglandin dehydrogenase [NAD(+)]-like isoform X2 [Glandiceps talaboti]
MEVQDKVALITGGASGIGRAIAERLLQLEVKGIALIDLDNEKGKETTKQLTEKYGEGRTLFISCNVTSKDGLEAAFVKTKSTFGGLDLVFNNAGVMDEFNWELTVDVNLKAVVTGTYLALEHMGTKHGGNGGIVMNTASIIGFVPSPFVPMYGTTKAAVIEFTRSVANFDLKKTTLELRRFVLQRQTRLCRLMYTVDILKTSMRSMTHFHSHRYLT